MRHLQDSTEGALAQLLTHLIVIIDGSILLLHERDLRHLEEVRPAVIRAA